MQHAPWNAGMHTIPACGAKCEGPRIICVEKRESLADEESLSDWAVGIKPEAMEVVGDLGEALAQLQEALGRALLCLGHLAASFLVPGNLGPPRVATREGQVKTVYCLLEGMVGLGRVNRLHRAKTAKNAQGKALPEARG